MSKQTDLVSTSQDAAVDSAKLAGIETGATANGTVTGSGTTNGANTGDNTVATALTGTPNISVGTVTASGTVNGSGSVVKVQNYLLGANVNQQTTSIGAVALANWNVSFTKKFSDSIILCHLKWYAYYGAADGSWWRLKALVGGSPVTSNTGVGTWENGTISTHNGDQYTYQRHAHQEYTTHFWDDRAGTSVAMTFTIEQGLAGALYIWNSGKPSLTIMEVRP